MGKSREFHFLQDAYIFSILQPLTPAIQKVFLTSLQQTTAPFTLSSKHPYYAEITALEIFNEDGTFLTSDVEQHFRDYITRIGIPYTAEDYIAEFEALPGDTKDSFIEAMTLKKGKPIKPDHKYYPTFSTMICCTRHDDNTLSIKEEADTELFKYCLQTILSQSESTKPLPPKKRPFIFNHFYYSQDELAAIRSNPDSASQYLYNDSKPTPSTQNNTEPNTNTPKKDLSRSSYVMHLSLSTKGRLLVYCTTIEHAQQLAVLLKLTHCSTQEYKKRGVLTIETSDIESTLTKLGKFTSYNDNRHFYGISKATAIESKQYFLPQQHSLSK